MNELNLQIKAAHRRNKKKNTTNVGTKSKH